MAERSGPPTTKLETAEQLDALLGNASATVVVGIFGPAYQGASSREVFAESARDLLEAGRLSFVEVSTRVANAAKIFAGEAQPFDTATSVCAVVRSPKWLGKGETPYHTMTEFRKMRSCAPLAPRAAPRAHSRRTGSALEERGECLRMPENA